MAKNIIGFQEIFCLFFIKYITKTTIEIGTEITQTFPVTLIIGSINL